MARARGPLRQQPSRGEWLSPGRGWTPSAVAAGVTRQQPPRWPRCDPTVGHKSRVTSPTLEFRFLGERGRAVEGQRGSRPDSRGGSSFDTDPRTTCCRRGVRTHTGHYAPAHVCGTGVRRSPAGRGGLAAGRRQTPRRRTTLPPRRGSLPHGLAILHCGGGPREGGGRAAAQPGNSGVAPRADRRRARAGRPMYFGTMAGASSSSLQEC